MHFLSDSIFNKSSDIKVLWSQYFWINLFADLPSKPELIVEPQKPDNTYKEEDSVRLSCMSRGRPQPVISWFKDDTFLDSGADPVEDQGQ